MFAARKALLRLVQAKDDVPDYWTELGKVQASMGSYGDAYYAFTRAYELNRSNPDLLRALTQLALRSGDLATAEARADELAIVAPGDPWVKLTKGWSAVYESRFDEAVSIADQLLAQNAYDPLASALKARSLFGLDRTDEAITFLTDHLKAIPSDFGAIELLAQIYESRDQWAPAAGLRQQAARLRPQDEANWLSLIEASFRSGKVSEARAASLRLLQPQSAPSLVSSVMDLWASYWPSPRRVEDARRLGASAPPHQRIVYAAFLSRVGGTGDAMKLVASDATLPVNANNAEANAVLADALSRTGNAAAAKSRLDAVIAFDPGNATALRARVELQLRTGRNAEAVRDAEKLVTVVPTSAGDRLLLAKAYAAAGNQRWAERTLWTAFNDIPANDGVYAALKATKSGNAEALADLQAEFEKQRDAKVRKVLL
jgi:predicted Zn-dependent protease